MKYVIITLLFPLISYSQTKTTNIEYVKIFNGYGSGTTTVNHADSVFIGKIEINQTLRPKAHLGGINQKQTSDGKYLTTINVINSDNNLPFFGITINLIFNIAVSAISYSGNGCSAMGVIEEMAIDKKSYRLSARQINCQSFEFEIISESKVFVTIHGLDKVID